MLRYCCLHSACAAHEEAQALGLYSKGGGRERKHTGAGKFSYTGVVVNLNALLKHLCLLASQHCTQRCVQCTDLTRSQSSCCCAQQSPQLGKQHWHGEGGGLPTTPPQKSPTPPKNTHHPASHFSLHTI